MLNIKILMRKQQHNGPSWPLGIGISPEKNISPREACHYVETGDTQCRFLTIWSRNVI